LSFPAPAFIVSGAMAEYDFDLLTIGAGSGGVAASRRAGSYGARVAICEEGRIGGTCVLRGCVPKKLLVYGAHYQDELADMRGFGWSVEGARFDWSKLVAAKDAELDRLEGVYRRLLRDAGVTHIEGRARLVDGHTVEVDGKQHTAKHVLVATGGRPVLPAIRGVELCITSNEALSLPALPRRMLVVGGGYIGVELAGVFASLGVKVTIVIRGEAILRGFDEDVRAHLTNEMRKRGITIRDDSRVRDVERKGEGLSVLLDGDECIDTDVVLLAIGRTPSTRGVGLEEAGVALDADGAVIVDAGSRTTLESVYAVGDCTNRLNLTPVAIAEGRAVAESLFGKGPRLVDRTGVPTAVFSQPPVGTVGLTEGEARARGAIDVYVSSFRPMKHTLSGRDERTMMKLVVDRATDRVLGVHVVGPDAPEIVQGVAIALRAGATKAIFDETIGIHPTAAEELVTMRTPRTEPAKDA
jgi:glutathione reductase (NADPH)